MNHRFTIYARHLMLQTATFDRELAATFEGLEESLSWDEWEPVGVYELDGDMGEFRRDSENEMAIWVFSDAYKHRWLSAYDICMYEF